MKFDAGELVSATKRPASRRRPLYANGTVGRTVFSWYWYGCDNVPYSCAGRIYGIYLGLSGACFCEALRELGRHEHRALFVHSDFDSKRSRYCSCAGPFWQVIEFEKSAVLLRCRHMSTRSHGI